MSLNLIQGLPRFVSGLGGFFVMLLTAIAFVILLWAAIDCAERTFPKRYEKPLWLLTVLCGMPPLGAIVYLAVRHSEFSAPEAEGSETTKPSAPDANPSAESGEEPQVTQ